MYFVFCAECVVREREMREISLRRITGYVYRSFDSISHVIQNVNKEYKKSKIVLFDDFQFLDFLHKKDF